MKRIGGVQKHRNCMTSYWSQVKNPLGVSWSLLFLLSLIQKKNHRLHHLSQVKGNIQTPNLSLGNFSPPQNTFSPHSEGRPHERWDGAGAMVFFQRKNVEGCGELFWGFLEMGLVCRYHEWGLEAMGRSSKQNMKGGYLSLKTRTCWLFLPNL